MTKTDLLAPEITGYLRGEILRLDPAARALAEATEALPTAHYRLALEQGQFLALLVETIAARRILDVGCFTGFSALVMALAAGPDARIESFDVSDQHADLARAHWTAAGVSDRIDLEIGPAAIALETRRAEGASGRYDLAFIDADKEGYARYYELSLDLVRPGGLIVLDNMLWRGRVADPAETGERTRALRALNAHIASDPRVSASLVPFGDGMTVALCKPAPTHR